MPVLHIRSDSAASAPNRFHPPVKAVKPSLLPLANAYPQS